MTITGENPQISTVWKVKNQSQCTYQNSGDGLCSVQISVKKHKGTMQARSKKRTRRRAIKRAAKKALNRELEKELEDKTHRKKNPKD